MELTKKQAVENHRKMWNWIADQLERDDNTKDVIDLKEAYCKENNYSLIHDCFCCEYAKSAYREYDKNNCLYCPILWGSENHSNNLISHYCEPKGSLNSNMLSWYKAYKLSSARQYKEASEIARQIANLPERPDDEYDILEERSDTNGKNKSQM